MAKGPNLSTEILNGAPCSPEFSWMRRHRALLTMIFFAGGVGLVELGMFRIGQGGRGSEKEIPMRESAGYPISAVGERLKVKISVQPQPAAPSLNLQASDGAQKRESSEVRVVRYSNRQKSALDAPAPAEQAKDLGGEKKGAAEDFKSLPYLEMVKTVKELNFDQVVGNKEVVQAFERLMDAIQSDNPTEIEKAAKEYLVAYEGVDSPEARKSYVAFLSQLPKGTNYKLVNVVLGEAQIFAKCLAESDCAPYESK